MAKKKKAVKRRKTHRRIGGVNKLDIATLGFAVAGAVIAKVITNNLSTSTNATLLKFGPYVPLVAGVVLPMVVKNPLVAKISIGLVAGGGITALGSTGLKVISGFENSIGYPGRANYSSARALVNGIAGPSGNQGLQKGTRSNFSGSRMSQIATIGAVNDACACN